MHLVEVLEGRWQLRHRGWRTPQVHTCDVVASEGDEALGHAFALRTAHG